MDKSFDLNNIYARTQPHIKQYEDDNREIQLDKDLRKTGKVAKHSVYGCDFVNWGDLSQKLVLKRPDEKYYPMKFRGQSSFAADQNKVQNDIKTYNKERAEQLQIDEHTRLVKKFEAMQKKQNVDKKEEGI